MFDVTIYTLTTWKHTTTQIDKRRSREKGVKYLYDLKKKKYHGILRKSHKLSNFKRLIIKLSSCRPVSAAPGILKRWRHLLSLFIFSLGQSRRDRSLSPFKKILSLMVKVSTKFHSKTRKQIHWHQHTFAKPFAGFYCETAHRKWSCKFLSLCADGPEAQTK